MSTLTPPNPRAPLLLMFAAAAVASFGLGLLGLAVVRPVEPVPTLPVPNMDSAQPGAGAAMPVEARAPWAALFGTPEPEPVIVPEPEPEPAPALPDEPDDVDLSHLVLRGLVYQEGGGWALLETDEGIMVIRRGDFLPSGEEVALIAEDGVEIAVDDELYFIGFDVVNDTLPLSPQDRQQQDRQPQDLQDNQDWQDDDDEPSSPSGAVPTIGPRLPFGIGSVGR